MSFVVLGHAADQLVDVEQNRPVGVHVWLDVQDNARVHVVDRVDDGVVRAEHGRAAGRYRNLITHLDDASPLSTTTSEGLERILTSVIAESALMTTRGDAGLPATIFRPPDKPGPVGFEPLFEATLLLSARNLSRRRVGNCAAGEEKLHPVVELIVQRHFCDGDIDCDLQFRPVERNQRPLDQLVFVGPRIDEHRVIGYIGRDPDIGNGGPPDPPCPSALSSELSAATGAPPNCAAAVR